MHYFNQNLKILKIEHWNQTWDNILSSPEKNLTTINHNRLQTIDLSVFLNNQKNLKPTPFQIEPNQNPQPVHTKPQTTKPTGVSFLATAPPKPMHHQHINKRPEFHGLSKIWRYSNSTQRFETHPKRTRPHCSVCNRPGFWCNQK